MKTSSVILLLLLGAGFVGGLIHLFNLRFEAGDVYPAYSSLRADPLGTKAFYDSLDELMPARRNFDSLSKLSEGRETTLLYLGESPEKARFTTNQFRVFETFIRSGGRLVLAFQPAYAAPRANRFTTARTPPAIPPPTVPTNQPPTRSRRPRDPLDDFNTVPLRDRWQLDYGYAPLERDDRSAHVPATAHRRTNAPWPERLPIHTALFFDSLDPAWQILYSRREGTNDHPVIIERPMGRGSIVLAADAYPFSNEALRQERHPQLLAWFIGASRHVIFDETHLGTQSDPGIAAMARRYRLHAFAAALVILAGLFIWRNSVSFMPPYEEQLAGESSHQVEGKDSAEGFIHLLRRNVPPIDILKVCLEQWNSSAAPARRPAPWKLEAMQKLIDEQNALDPRRRNPVRTYQQFCEILAQRT